MDCNVNSKQSANPWRFETNWIVAHGSLEASVTVEASDNPIDDSGPESLASKSPLVLKPPYRDSAPCEIKMCFDQKYEVGQIYVRSTARTYEIYYTHSARSINEYLCTVRCSVAERDDKVIQINCIEGVPEEHGECLPGEVTAETAADAARIVASEDDWIDIKVPEGGGVSASDKISTNGSNNIQDFYEATAQISDSDPCLSLTIRLLSLQDKEHVYVDEIYVFVDPVESTDSGNEAATGGSSAQSSLMAMFMPTLLQLSKSGANRVQDKYAFDEVPKNGKMETGSSILDKIDCHQQSVRPQELDKDTAESSELKQHTSAEKCVEPKNKLDFQHVKLKEPDEDTAESSQLQQHTLAEIYVEPKNKNDMPRGHLEVALEQLVSRLSRVEDICLRFEEKMLKPIESIGARLQQVENQLEKLAKNSHSFGVPHCTRISAPAFSCSESNSSSFYNEQSDYPPRGASDLEKDFSCNNMPELSHVAKFHPSLVVSAPEFSCGECEEDNNDLNPMNDSPCIEPKKTLSVDDALAATLNRFLSTASINPSEHIQTTLGLSSQVNEGNQYQGHAECWQIKAQEFSDADNGIRESLQYAQVLMVKAPDFTAEEAGDEEHFTCTHSSLETASVEENEKKDHGGEVVCPTSVDSCDFGKYKSIGDFGSASNGDSPAVSVKLSRTCPGNGHVNGCSEVNVIDSYFEGDTGSGPTGISNDSATVLAECSVEASKHEISDETDPPEKSTSFNTDDKDNASEQVLGHVSASVSGVLEEHVVVERCFKDDIPNVSEGKHISLVDFKFPILEVKFTSDVHTCTQSPLEALLDGAAQSNPEAASVNAIGNDDGNMEQINADITNGNETTDCLPSNHLLVDLGLGVSAADDSSSLDDKSHDLCAPCSPEINVSLI